MDKDKVKRESEKLNWLRRQLTKKEKSAIIKRQARKDNLMKNLQSPCDTCTERYCDIMKKCDPRYCAECKLHREVGKKDCLKGK